MYCLVMQDENGFIDIYKIGEEIKSYSKEEDVQKEIDDMIRKEEELFGDVKTKYRIAEYEDW